VLCKPQPIGLGTFVAGVALPLAAALAVSFALVLALGRLGRRRPDAFAASLAALIGLLLFPAIIIVPDWLVGASLTHTNARGVALLTIFGAFGSWLASPAIVPLCAAARWVRGAARPAIPWLILTIGVLANWLWANWWGGACS
jgi:hypothetical protein